MHLAEVQSGPASTVSKQDILDTLARVTASLKTALDPESKLPKDALQSALNDGEALVAILESQNSSAGQSSGEGPLDITPSAVQEVQIHLQEGIHDIAFEQNNPVTGLTTVFIRPKSVKSDDYKEDDGVITRSEARRGLNFMPIGGEFRDGSSKT